MSPKISTFILVLLFALVSCTSGGGGSDDSSDGAGGGGGDIPSKGDRSFLTDCGTVVEGVLKNPVNEADGILINVVQVTGPKSVIIERANGRQAVELHGLSKGVNEFQARRARDVLDSFIGPALFVQPTSDCTVSSSGGGTGTAGQLFRNSDGASATETLLKNGVAVESSSNRCNSSVLRACYDALAEANTEETGASVRRFIWKPVSEQDGNLAVLFSPSGARVFVAGEELVNTGPSNGRGTTARGNRSGCGYGANIPIQARDSRGRLLIWPGAETTYFIPNGCDRVEF